MGKCHSFETRYDPYPIKDIDRGIRTDVATTVNQKWIAHIRFATFPTVK